MHYEQSIYLLLIFIVDYDYVTSCKLQGDPLLQRIGRLCLCKKWWGLCELELEKKWTTPKIDEYIHGDYQRANKDDYLLYQAAQRSLDKTIDALGRKHVEKNDELLKSLQQQNEEQCASKITLPCPEPKDESMKNEHKRLANESCYFLDFGALNPRRFSDSLMG